MKKRTRLIYRQLLAASLIMSGALPLALPVLAEGTTAGTNISNTANATYEDPNNPGTTINTTSNPVEVKIAEVAGITVSASGITDNSPADPVKVGDVLYYNYTITNVGNDPTKFRIPNLATTTGPATAGTLEVSTDGGVTWAPVSGAELITSSIPVDGSVLVRVPVTVQPGAQPNDVITVTLGDTPGDAQNQARNPNGGDVFTVDNPDSAGAPEVAGAPSNGTREASITQQAKVANTLKTLALATLSETRGAYDNANTAAINDDKLTYDMSLKVESSDPTGNSITPAPLVGTPIMVNGASSNRILISDAIPKDTELAVAPTAPLGWQVVYTTDPVTTDANTAVWSTTAPALSAVTRVGFVNNPATITSIAPGTTVTGFSMQVKVKSSITATSLPVANIAQVFGQTPGTNVPVMDESGDNSPSNYSPGATPTSPSIPPAGTDTNNDGVPDVTTLPPGSVDDGFINNPADPETGTDPGNNNNGDPTSKDPTGGEANTFTVQEPVQSSLQNGPLNNPDAVGPTNQNDDFTNKSAFVPPDQKPGALVDPSPVAFSNSVKNNGTDPGTVILEPKAPATPSDLPKDTLVTISYGSDSVVYKYDGTTFVPVSSTVPGGGPIKVTGVQPNAVVNYGVEIDLPAGTPLSTDQTDAEKGFPVPIVAKIDTNNDGVVDATNETIGRVYTGYMKMEKMSRVLPGTGPAVQGQDGTFSSDPKKPAPGNILEYQIKYTNISDPQAGTGNVTVSADKVVITEDGMLSTAPGDGKNNWAKDNDGNGVIDTSNVTGSAADSGTSTIQFFNGAATPGIDQNGTTSVSDVTKYVDTVTGKVAPGQVRTFTFQRKVN